MLEIVVAFLVWCRFSIVEKRFSEMSVGEVGAAFGMADLILSLDEVFGMVGGFCFDLGLFAPSLDLLLAISLLGRKAAEERIEM